MPRPCHALDPSLGPQGSWVQLGRPRDGPRAGPKPGEAKEPVEAGTHCQGLQRVGEAALREALTLSSAWGRNFQRNVSYEGGGEGRPGQSQCHSAALGQGGGGARAEGTLGALGPDGPPRTKPQTHPPRELGTPCAPKGRGTQQTPSCSASKGLPSRGPAAAGRWPSQARGVRHREGPSPVPHSRTQTQPCRSLPRSRTFRLTMEVTCLGSERKLTHRGQQCPQGMRLVAGQHSGLPSPHLQPGPTGHRAQ